jgi:hypothetical protein
VEKKISKKSQDDATAEDLYNFDVSVALTEIQSDEIDAEFAEAIQEIDGERVFPFSQCEKECKSKGGSTKQNSCCVTKETVASIILNRYIGQT